MVNQTAMARMHKIRSQGVGGSREAVLARRSRETMNNLAQIDRGERLPGWMQLPVFRTPEEVSAFFESLEPEAREEAQQLFAEQFPDFSLPTPLESEE